VVAERPNDVSRRLGIGREGKVIARGSVAALRPPVLPPVTRSQRSQVRHRGDGASESIFAHTHPRKQRNKGNKGNVMPGARGRSGEI